MLLIGPKNLLFLLAPFVAAARKMTVGRAAGAQAPNKDETGDDFRWLVEEFRVSLFAQELGTAEPVSVVRLQRALDEMAGATGATPGRAGAVPVSKGVAPASSGRKATPLKSLGALDQLFRK